MKNQSTWWHRYSQYALYSLVAVKLSSCASTLSTDSSIPGFAGNLGKTGPAKFAITQFQATSHRYDRIRFVTNGDQSSDGIFIFSSLDGLNWDKSETQRPNITSNWYLNADVTIAATSDRIAAIAWINGDPTADEPLEDRLAYAYFDRDRHSTNTPPPSFVSRDIFFSNPSVTTAGGSALLAATGLGDFHYEAFRIDNPPLDSDGFLDIPSAKIVDSFDRCTNFSVVPMRAEIPVGGSTGNIANEYTQTGIARRSPDPIFTAFIDGYCNDQSGNGLQRGAFAAIFKIDIPTRELRLNWLRFVPQSDNSRRDLELSVSTREDGRGGAISVFSYGRSTNLSDGETISVWSKTGERLNRPIVRELADRAYSSIDAHVRRPQNADDPGVFLPDIRRVVVTAGDAYKNAPVDLFSWDFITTAPSTAVRLTAVQRSGTGSASREVIGRNAISADFLACFAGPDGLVDLDAFWEARDNTSGQTKIVRRVFGRGSPECDGRPDPR